MSPDSRDDGPPHDSPAAALSSKPVLEWTPEEWAAWIEGAKLRSDPPKAAAPTPAAPPSERPAAAEPKPEPPTPAAPAAVEPNRVDEHRAGGPDADADQDETSEPASPATARPAPAERPAAEPPAVSAAESAAVAETPAPAGNGQPTRQWSRAELDEAVERAGVPVVGAGEAVGGREPGVIAESAVRGPALFDHEALDDVAEAEAAIEDHAHELATDAEPIAGPDDEPPAPSAADATAHAVPDAAAEEAPASAPKAPQFRPAEPPPAPRPKRASPERRPASRPAARGRRAPIRSGDPALVRIRSAIVLVLVAVLIGAFVALMIVAIIAGAATALRHAVA